MKESDEQKEPIMTQVQLNFKVKSLPRKESEELDDEKPQPLMQVDSMMNSTVKSYPLIVSRGVSPQQIRTSYTKN